MAVDRLCHCCPDKRAFRETSGSCPVARACKWVSPNLPHVFALRRQPSSPRYASVNALRPRSRSRSLQKCSPCSSSKFNPPVHVQFLPAFCLWFPAAATKGKTLEEIEREL